MPHQVMLDDELYAVLKVIKDNLTKARGANASYGDVIRLSLALRNDLPSLIAPKFDDVNKILLVYYEGDRHKAHLSKVLYDALLQGVRSEAANEYLQENIVKVYENAMALNAINPAAKKFEVKQ